MTRRIINVSQKQNLLNYYSAVYWDQPVGWYRFKELVRPDDPNVGPLGLTFNQLDAWWDTSYRRVINTMDTGSVYSSIRDTEGTWNIGAYVPADATDHISNLLYLDEPNWTSGLAFAYNYYRGWRNLASIPIKSNLLSCPIGTSRSWSLEFWFVIRNGSFETALNRRDSILKGGSDSSNYWAFEATSYFSKNGSNYNYAFRIGNQHYLFTPILRYPENLSTRWHHYVITYSQSTNNLRLYVDGEQADFADTGSTVVSSPGGSQNVWLGIEDNGLIKNWCGIAELAYYDYCLLADDVKRHFLAAP